MEVVAPSPAQEFFFDSACTTPYLSAPSSPKLPADPFDYLSHYTSAPSSPRRAAAIYAHFGGTSAAKPDDDDDEEDSEFDFAFEFSGQLDKGKPPPALTAADELFDKGRIRPLKPPAPLPPSLPTPPRSPRRRGPAPEAARRSRRESRSLSPLRGGGAPPPLSAAASSSPTTTIGSILKSGHGGKRWRLRDLLLFRSASEGRATERESKDPLRKYTLLSTSSSSLLNRRRRSGGEDSKSSSSRSAEDGGGGSVGRSRPGASAHEMHYTANRAAAEEMKKKTALPYRQGLFGCLKLNPAINSIARGFGGYSFDQRR